MSKKWKIGIVLIFILILVISISGCSTLAEYIPLLASPTTIFFSHSNVHYHTDKNASHLLRQPLDQHAGRTGCSQF